MPIAAAIGAVGAIGGSLVQSSAAKKATKQQAAGQKASQANYEAAMADIKGQLDPYMQVGQQGLSELSSLILGGPNADAMMASLENYPGYKFAVEQAKKGINADAAMKGSRVSGNQTQGAIDYMLGAAGGLFDKYLGNLSNLTGIGERATQNYTLAKSGMAEKISGAMTGAANAKASGTAATGQIWGNAADQIGGLAMYTAKQNPGSWLNEPVSSLWKSGKG